MIRRLISRIGAWLWVIGAVVGVLFLIWRYRSLTQRIRTARTGARHAEEAQRLGQNVATMEVTRQQLEREARESAAEARAVKASAVAAAEKIRERGFTGMADLVEHWNAGA